MPLDARAASGRTFLWTIALALAASCSATRASHPRGEAAAGHPKVKAERGCAECHEGVTPEVVSEWSGGKHGLVLVQCFVCHGSTGDDFAQRPVPQRCQGCHPVEVGSLASAPGAGACFACHKPHALSVASGQKRPHAAP